MSKEYDDQTDLSFASFPLPEAIVEYYHQKGIDKFFPWQVECLRQPGVLISGRNLVFSAPTSAGKSMVADVVMLQTVLERKKKAIVILPFVSIAQEKVQSLKQLFRSIGIRIDSFAGSSNPRGGLDLVDVAVCTIEKANNIVNRLIEENRLSEIGLIVVDELHMLGDSNRGYLLELLLSKLLYLNKYSTGLGDSQISENNSTGLVQIIGMSATIPNLSAIAKWLDAELYVTNYRPVPLFQKIVCDNEVFLAKKNETNGHLLVKCDLIDLTDLAIEQDDAALIYSAIETVIEGHSALTFCSTKVNCEKISRFIAKNIFEFGGGKKKHNNSERIDQIGQKLKDALDGDKIQTLINSLKQTAFGIDNNLAATIRFGVAFHHAGLSMEERALIENAFRDGTVRILCSTTTLSAGVNLPARRVLICSPFDYKGALLDVTCYLQMTGRAGRQGIDQLGESMLFCKKKDFQRVVDSLVNAKLPPVKSCLLSVKDQSTSHDGTSAVDISSSLKRAILEVIANGTATHYADLARYVQCTFFEASINTEVGSSRSINVNSAIKQVFDGLIGEQLIYQDVDQSRLIISPLGKAIVASGVSPDMGQFIMKELNRARHELSLVADLHLIYQVTPTYVAEQLDKIDWNLYLTIWSKLSPDEKAVAALVGVEERYLISRKMDFSMSKLTQAQLDKLLVHKRFYASLALNDLAQEMPLLSVASKYCLSKGIIQSLQQQSAQFAGMLTTFCAKLGWRLMALLIEQFQTRLSFGIQSELIDLMRIPLLNSCLARQLYQKGFESLLRLVYHKVSDIEDALICTGSFEKQQATDTSSSTTAKIDPASAKVFIPLLDQYVTIRKLSELILREARFIVENDVGQKLSFDDTSGISQVSTMVLSHPVRVSQPPTQSTLVHANLLPSASMSSSKTDVLQTSTPKYSRLAPTSKDGFIIDSTNNSSNTKTNFTVIKNSTLKRKQDETDFSFDDSLNNDISWDKMYDSKRQSKQNLSKGTPTEICRSGDDEFDEFDDLELAELLETNNKSAGKESAKKSRTTRSGSPLMFDSDDSLMADLQPTTSSDAGHNLKPPRDINSTSSLEDLFFMDDDEEDHLKTTGTLSDSTKADNKTKSRGDNKQNIENISDFFQTFRENRLEQCALPSSFSAASTTKIAIDKYQLVEVNSESECQQMLQEIFSMQVLSDDDDAVLDIAVHFRFFPIDLNAKRKKAKISNANSETGFIVDTRYPMELKELNLARLGHSRVFQINSTNIFLYLRTQLGPWLSKLDSSFETGLTSTHRGSVSSTDSSGDGNRQKRFRFLTYDIKKALYLFQFGLHLPFNALMHRIDWYDLSVAIWLFDPEGEQFNIDKLSMQGLVQLTLRFKLLECQSFFQTAQLALLGQVTTRKKRQTKSSEPASVSKKDSLLKTAVLFHLMGQFCQKLFSDKLLQAYKLIELPARHILYLMQTQGIRIDHKLLIKEQARLSRYMEYLEKLIYQAAGQKVNLNSPKEVASVLYDKLDLMSYFDVKKSAKSSKVSSSAMPRRPHSRSTSKLALIKLQEVCGSNTNLPTLVMDWRRLNHAYNHSVVAIRNALSFDQTEDGHAKFGNIAKDKFAFIYCQCEEWSATGRISLYEPNLINVDKDFQVRSITQAVAQQLDQQANTSSGKQDSDQLDSQSNIPVEIKLRKLICARVGYVLVCADYSQLELRILTHFTKDPVLLATLNDPSSDVFTSIAAGWKQIPSEQVTYEMRQQAKQICYGIIYGMGNRSLAASLEVTEEEAAGFRKSFLERYARIEPFVNEVIEQCRASSCVKTISQRRRIITNITSEDLPTQWKGQRQAVNTMVQGSAADMIKLAMVAVGNAVRKLQLDASLIMQMHDELMYEVRQDQAAQFAALLKQQMEQVSQHLDVILPVKVCSGPNWGSLGEVNVFCDS